MVLWFTVLELESLKTTVELSDDLYRRAKATAALRGQKFKELVEEGLRRVLEAPEGERARPRLAELMQDACGVVDSGIPDLASNPEHLAGFGRDAGRDR
jgi:predicted component of type VI protein secretion system